MNRVQCPKCSRTFASNKAINAHQSIHRSGYVSPVMLRSLKALDELLIYIDGRLKYGYIGLNEWNEVDRQKMADIIAARVPHYHQARGKE